MCRQHWNSNLHTFHLPSSIYLHQHKPRTYIHTHTHIAQHTSPLVCCLLMVISEQPRARKRVSTQLPSTLGPALHLTMLMHAPSHSIQFNSWVQPTFTEFSLCQALCYMLEQNWPLFSTNAWTSESFKVPSLKGLVFLVASSRIFVRYFFFCLKRKKRGVGIV